ncbi:hypothetical protein [Flavobacterium sp. ASW18X]|uniref:immunity protein Imm33 domain-containing protein n=1 Tax=Flavobacterium sp. ASW18X TaxID=2572595 RepID=UPI0010AE3799|nr:hypothetical protein [Flavobacterium sp. ASW18X]TKD62293.1 hypothetical protein FBT53_10200 [Flavobacterium sp. ASW18X]
MIGVSKDLNQFPLNGLRHPNHGNMCGWYIWSGEWSNKSDFFKPLCAEHLIEQKPEIIQYLALDIGFRFLSSQDNYEDIWFDENITIL